MYVCVGGGGGGGEGLGLVVRKCPLRKIYSKLDYTTSSCTQTDQGIKCLSVDRAAKLSGDDPDYALRDLYESIANRKFVRHVTVM